jgi:hypothetical protein
MSLDFTVIIIITYTKRKLNIGPIYTCISCLIYASKSYCNKVINEQSETNLMTA